MRKRELTVQKSHTANLIGIILERHPEINQIEIANHLGFSEGSANSIMTQLKSGRTKLPFDYIVPLCKYLNEDPAPLLVCAMDQYLGEVIDAMKETGLIKDEFFEILKSVAPDKIRAQVKKRGRVKIIRAG